MTLTKLALAVLGTIGLTAGTVLAVAEPLATPLPTAIAQVSKGACPGSSRASGKCSTGACPFSAKTVPASACTTGECTTGKCASAKCAAPPKQSEPIAAELEKSPSIAIGTCLGEKLKACSVSAACESLFDADGICRKHFVGVSKSGCVVTGDVVLTSAESDRCDGQSCKTSTCSASACSASTCDKGDSCGAEGCKSASCEGQCKGECGGKCEEACRPPVVAKKATRRITLGIGLSTHGPIVHVATQTNGNTSASSKAGCSAASAVGRIVLSLFDGDEHAACADAPHEVAATACEAKPACVSLGCPVATCSASDCDCSPCECGSCACEEHSATLADDAGSEKEHEVDLYADGVRYRVRDVTIRYFDGLGRIHETSAPLSTIGGVHSDLVGDYPPLKVPNWDEQPRLPHPPFRIAGVPERHAGFQSGLPPVIVPGGHDEADCQPEASEAPGRVRVTHGPINVHYQYLPEPPVLPLSPRIRLSGFAAPVAAPLPPRADSPRLEGAWTRSSGPCSSEFTYRGDRIHGTWRCNEGIGFRFSGSCLVTRDEQLIGVIDEVELIHDADQKKGFVDRMIAIGQHHLVQCLVDQPFAARFVLDGDALIIKDIRCHGSIPEDVDQDAAKQLLETCRSFAFGRFERSSEN